MCFDFFLWELKIFDGSSRRDKMSKSTARYQYFNVHVNNIVREFLKFITFLILNSLNKSKIISIPIQQNTEHVYQLKKAPKWMFLIK